MSPAEIGALVGAFAVVVLVMLAGIVYNARRLLTKRHDPTAELSVNSPLVGPRVFEPLTHDALSRPERRMSTY